MTLRTEHVEVNFKLELRKDLLEDEEICDKCGGGGLTVDDHPFGLAGEWRTHTGRFPNKKQTIGGCGHCYGGVQKKCTFCNSLMGRKQCCTCEGYLQMKADERFQSDMEVWGKAGKVSVADLVESEYGNMLYLANEDIFFMDIFELLEHLEYKLKDGDLTEQDIHSIRVYKTDLCGVSFNADSIISDAAGDFLDHIDQEFTDELQVYLNGLAERIKSSSRVYEPDYTKGVEVRIEDILGTMEVEGV